MTVPVYQQLQFVKEEGRGEGGGGGGGEGEGEGGGIEGGGCDAPSSSLSTRRWRRLPSISLLAASQDHHPNNSTRLLNPKTFGIASWPSLQPSSFIKYSNGKTYSTRHRAIIILGKNRANLNFWKNDLTLRHFSCVLLCNLDFKPCESENASSKIPKKFQTPTCELVISFYCCHSGNRDWPSNRRQRYTCAFEYCGTLTYFCGDHIHM